MFFQRCHRIVIVAVLTVLPALAGRYKLNIDPETKEGYILQQIKQERTPAKKLTMMVQFVEEFPKDENVPWVVEQLLPFYTEEKAWDKVIAAGEKLLSVDAKDQDAAYSCLRAAEALNNPDTLRKYSTLAWKTADLITESPKPKDPAEVALWQKQSEDARNLKLYAEYAVYALSKAGGEKKEEYLQALEQLNPRSVYLIAARQQEQKANMTIPAILEGLDKEPHNPDYLAILADHFMRVNDLQKAMLYSGRLIQAFDGNFKPENMALKEWTAKRDRYIGQALWMNGIMSSVLGSYHQADRSLRAALPYMRANPNLLSAGLYHLGYVNYRLAEKGEPNRVFEAIKFNQECAAIKGAYQEQATKNIAAIKSEYNLR
jgi:hypothetical protein